MSAPMMRVSASVVKQLARQVGVARRVDVAHGDADELEGGSGAVGELVAVLAQQRGDLGADGSGAEQRDAQAAVVGHFDSLRSLSTGMRPFGGAGEARVAGEQVVDRLAAHDDAGLSPAHRHDRRAGDVVVVAREREAVGAGRGHGEQVAGCDVAGQVLGVDDDVARLAVLADDAHERGLGVALARRDAAPSTARRRARGARCRSCRRRRSRRGASASSSSATGLVVPTS